MEIPEEVRVVTSSSFTQVRDKIKFDAFKEVATKLCDFYYSSFSYKTFHGLRLVAIDGSVFTLPRNKQTIEEFGENVLSDNRKWIKSQVCFASDVINNICLEASISAYKTDERSLAIQRFSKLGKNNLYLFDRGYFGRDFLADVFSTNCQFCFRVSVNACKEVMDFIKSGSEDEITNIKTKSGEIRVRITKIQLGKNEHEYLVSSLLNTSLFSVQKLKQLYHKRWGVEEQFKDMKQALLIENFIGKKPNSIRQEFYGNIISYNLSMMACKPLIDKLSNRTNGKKKHKYKANKRALISKLKQCFVRLFFGKDSIENLIRKIVLILSKESVPIRDGRKFERSKTFKAKRKPTSNCVPVV